LQTLLQEGLDNVYLRHQKAKDYTISRIEAMGLTLFAKSPEVSSPTVTAVQIPPHITWDQLNVKLREKGVCVGGSYGKLAKSDLSNPFSLTTEILNLAVSTLSFCSSW